MELVSLLHSKHNVQSLPVLSTLSKDEFAYWVRLGGLRLTTNANRRTFATAQVSLTHRDLYAAGCEFLDENLLSTSMAAEGNAALKSTSRTHHH